MDEVYVLGINGETEAMFNSDGSMFYNIIAGKEIIGRFTPTPVDLYLTNTSLNGTYEAQNSITVENNVTVGGRPTVLKAGNRINLKLGFQAPNGSNFTAEIEAVANTPKRYYYLKDHLGSIRGVVNETGDIVSSDDGVYPALSRNPWGMILNGRSTENAYLNSKYKFTGKERDKETGYDYFGARYFDSRIGRWIQVDPLAEKYPSLNPYNYTLNNPINLFDPNGQWPWVANQKNGPPIYSRFSSLISESSGIIYSSLSQSQRQEINHNQLERAVNIINNYSSEIGSFLINTQVPIAFAENLPENTGGWSLQGKIGAVLNSNLLEPYKQSELTEALAHETIHMMGGGEIAAYGVMLKTGLMSFTQFKDRVFRNIKSLEDFIDDDNKKSENIKSLLLKWFVEGSGGDKIYKIYVEESDKWLKVIQEKHQAE